MNLKKIEIYIPTSLYEKTMIKATLKGYKYVEDFIISIIKQDISNEDESKKLSENEIKIISKNDSNDVEEDSSYFSQKIQRDLESRGFGK